MSTKHLGSHIDISCGGIDNLYRHHDYTIAVVEAVYGGEYAHYWLHGEHLLVEGKKMSKSKGNVVYLDDLLREGFRPEHVRFHLIYRHYRRKLNFTRHGLQETSQRLDEFQQMARSFEGEQTCPSGSDKSTLDLIASITARFEDSMNNDLDVKHAFDSLFSTVSRLYALKKKRRLSKDELHRTTQALRAVDSVFQCLQASPCESHQSETRQTT
jgi:cysteinyl-tRNA synthetase